MTHSHRELHRVRVVSNRALRVGTLLMSLERTGPFVPGQCVGLTSDPALPPRSYSIASGVEDEHFEILYDLVRGGHLTPLLARATEGDTLYATEPFGGFADQAGKTVWVATGTGVAPFVSMTRSGAERDKTLAHGSRGTEGLYFRELFQGALGPRYVPCLSKDRAAFAWPGRVTGWLAARVADPEERYLLCGSAEMVVETRDLLIARGVSYTRIVAEVYF